MTKTNTLSKHALQAEGLGLEAAEVPGPSRCTLPDAYTLMERFSSQNGAAFMLGLIWRLTPTPQVLPSSGGATQASTSLLRRAPARTVSIHTDAEHSSARALEILIGLD
jgi:hypothetical protein